MTNTVPYRVGEWLPSDHATLSAWLGKRAAEAKASDAGLAPVLVEFQEFIESRPEIYMLFSEMFTEVPKKPPYDRDPAGDPAVRSYQQMLAVLNIVLTKTPEFNETGVVGFPINAILDWAMGTEAGFAAFVDPEVNVMLKKVISAFGEFLTSSASAAALNQDPKVGWLGDSALLAMVGALPAVPGSGELDYWDRQLTADQARQIFADTFVCDPTHEHWGFTSWDAFFTRTFREGKRPVAAPGDEHVVANACESAPYALARNVSEIDRFWTKGQPYSLRHMLADEDLAAKFVGGTVYQAFLSAKAYHRWHSPVSGMVVKVAQIEGTYYSEISSQGFFNPLHPTRTSHSSQAPDPAGPNDSQGYISEVATRALIVIDNPLMGLVGFLPIGMADVSSCDVVVSEGQRVEKGEELGIFHFGGSSHCLIFGPQVALDFDLHGQAPNLNAVNIPVCDRVAVVR
jgi:phosphatidylserine decarboxylase